MFEEFDVMGIKKIDLNEILIKQAISIGGQAKILEIEY